MMEFEEGRKIGFCEKILEVRALMYVFSIRNEKKHNPSHFKCCYLNLLWASLLCHLFGQSLPNQKHRNKSNLTIANFHGLHQIAMAIIQTEKRRKPKRRRRADGDFRFSSLSQTSLKRNIIRCMVAIIYCLVSLSSNGDLFTTGRKTQMVASALLHVPTTKKKPIMRSTPSFTTRTKTTTTRATKLASTNGEMDGSWRSNLPRDVYASPLLWEGRADWVAFLKQFDQNGDLLWEQVKLEAITQLSTEPEAGPQLYQSILSQGSLLEAIVSIIAST